jgi:ribonuclease VapC
LAVDTSALLAIQFEEAKKSWVLECLRSSETEPKMSVINLTETSILIRSRRLATYARVLEDILGLVRIVAPTLSQAELAAEARLRFPLNLGDCFAYALAKSVNEPILTLDADFRKTDARVLHPS